MVRIARQKLKLIVLNCDYAIELELGVANSSKELGVAIRQTIELLLGVAIGQKRVRCGYINISVILVPRISVGIIVGISNHLFENNRFY